MLATALALPDQPATVGPDWCWTYYAFAPPGALSTDAGPSSLTEADAWLVWLEATDDAPTGRRRAQSEQLRLVERFRTFDEWVADDLERYRIAATSDPTPATVCETFGARIVPEPDGSLPRGWEDRFIDPDDPAFSQAARAGEGTDR